MHAAVLFLSALGALHDCCVEQSYADAQSDTCNNASQACVGGMCMNNCTTSDDCVTAPSRSTFSGTPICLNNYCAFAVTTDNAGREIIDAVQNSKYCVRPKAPDGDFACCTSNSDCKEGATCEAGGQCIMDNLACDGSDTCPEGSTCLLHDDKSICRRIGNERCLSAASSARPAAALLAVCLALARS